MKTLTKLVSLSLLLLVGLAIGGATQANAEAYNPSYENFAPSQKANEEAIRLLKESGDDLQNLPVPVESLTIEQPIESTIGANSSLIRATKRSYNIDAILIDKNTNRVEYRSNYLAPAGFTWYDNGIPTSAVTKGSGNWFQFNGNVADTGIGAYDQGWYWRKFSTITNNKVLYFWASAWNLNDLIYN
ncbi:hypothetical protein ACWOFR_00155 [Carnobacterium gallinarum]|uniref:hypothetical protein n=1 Tax=Carnobacterium gallinarum TaxID=2749 RepID=UPI0005539E77|nr:hypothetical protein [Carnobacterium gallinarum]